MTSLADAHTAMPTLAGRRALISGGTTGIGRAIAVLLASEGARVFICGRDEAHLADALERVDEVGDGGGMAVDLADRKGVDAFVEAGRDFLGGIDIAVINAAIPAEALAETDRDALDYQIAADFTSYLQTAHAAAQHMQPGSDIILIGSMSAVSREPGNSIYTAAKAGVQGLAVGLRGELAERDIKVGLIEPGFTGADFQYPEYPPEKQVEMINAEQMLRAEDVAVAAQFMLQQPRRTAISLIRIEPRLDGE